jgi:hypothetical protein
MFLKAAGVGMNRACWAQTNLTILSLKKRGATCAHARAVCCCQSMYDNLRFNQQLRLG